MGLRLLHDEPTVAGFRILGQFTEYDGHKDEVVEPKTVLLDFEGIDYDGQPSGQPLEVATAQSQVQCLCQLGAKHGIVAALDRAVRSDDGLVLLQLVVELLERVVDAFTAVFIRQQMKQSGQLAGPTWLQALGGVAQRR